MFINFAGGEYYRESRVNGQEKKKINVKQKPKAAAPNRQEINSVNAFYGICTQQPQVAGKMRNDINCLLARLCLRFCSNDDDGIVLPSIAWWSANALTDPPIQSANAHWLQSRASFGSQFSGVRQPLTVHLTVGIVHHQIVRGTDIKHPCTVQSVFIPYVLELCK